MGNNGLLLMTPEPPLEMQSRVCVRDNMEKSQNKTVLIHDC